MKEHKGFISAFGTMVCFMVIALIISGCASVAPAATPTPVPSATATLTPLPPTATLTPLPTKTSTPTPVPTPADVGDVVPYRTVEITLVKITTHDLIVPGGLYYYYPKDRANKTFLDVGVRIRSLKPLNPLGVLVQDVLIQEEDGSYQAPAFASTNTVEVGAKYDPFKINIPPDPATAYDSLVFDKDTYLRLIFVVGKGHTILFSIEDSPQIRIDLGA